MPGPLPDTSLLFCYNKALVRIKNEHFNMAPTGFQLRPGTDRPGPLPHTAAGVA